MHLRRVIKPGEVESILTAVEAGANVPEPYRYDEARTRGWLQQLQRGEIAGIGRAFAQLCDVRDVRELFTLEAALFASAREWLMDELAAASGQPRETLGARLDDACD